MSKLLMFDLELSPGNFDEFGANGEKTFFPTTTFPHRNGRLMNLCSRTDVGDSGFSSFDR